MLKAFLIVLGLAAVGVATPALAQSAPKSSGLTLPERHVTGSAHRRDMHRNTLHRQRARATSEHARQIRQSR